MSTIIRPCPSTVRAFFIKRQNLRPCVCFAIRAALEVIGIINPASNILAECLRFYSFSLHIAFPLALAFCIFFCHPCCFGIESGSFCGNEFSAVIGEKTEAPPSKVDTDRQTEDKTGEILGRIKIEYNKLWNGDNGDTDKNFFDKHLLFLSGMFLGCLVGNFAKKAHWLSIENKWLKSKIKE